MKKGKVGVIGLTGQSAFMKTERFPQPGETVACSSLFSSREEKGTTRLLHVQNLE